MLETHKKKKKIVNVRRFAAFLLILLLAAAAIFGASYLARKNNAPAETVQYQIAYNRSEKARTADDILYIVVHETANTARGANAEHHYQYFNSGNRGSSADFFVDDSKILQANDFYSYYTWHCGDGDGKNGITNSNSIGVEICINRDGSYRRAVSNAAQLVRSLMQELGIDEAHVVRHYDASGKICPAKMAENDWRGWERFKKLLG